MIKLIIKDNAGNRKVLFATNANDARTIKQDYVKRGCKVEFEL